MAINTKIRSQAPELMDDFSMEGEMLREALDKIASINQILGGNKLTLQGVKSLIAKIPKSQMITIADIGCGNGDMLRILADYGFKNNSIFNLIGIDANAFTIKHAENLSVKYDNITYLCDDVFSEKFSNLSYDIVLCTLTLHHFQNEEILKLMTVLQRNSAVGIVVNDLQRSAISYRLFQALCFFFQLNKMSRDDGLVSILRGFKRNELAAFSQKLQFKKYKIQWKWAFRYQWIISNL